VPATALLVCEQLIAAAAPSLERADHLDHGRVLHRLLAPDAALAQIVEDEPSAGHGDAVLAHRGQTDPSVVVGVLLRANTKQPDVEQPDRAGQHARLIGIVPGPQRAQDAPAQAGERAGELKDVGELLAVAHLAPARVVEVLLAARRVDAGGLQVPQGIGADPHVLPCGRDRQLLNAQERLRIAEACAVEVLIAEPASPPDPSYALARAVRAAQPGATGPFLWRRRGCVGHQAAAPKSRKRDVMRASASSPSAACWSESSPSS
jgi:hypothetical protein